MSKENISFTVSDEFAEGGETSEEVEESELVGDKLAAKWTEKSRDKSASDKSVDKSMDKLADKSADKLKLSKGHKN